ncbi:MFS transporter [Staphylococcus gallinarum]|uniref:MFS transporter n=1 Tax=Staphylococcus gallinarum TaxID=1293 RepID=A0A3A0W0B8_STAGA|nr:oligosaccharide MFS transporter [Staphylococcus gallinarum]RIP33216.1 MFS transporter [Staphylococcus gallinarum]
MINIKRITFWRFGGINFFYFAIWTLIITFLPLWLNRVAHLNTAEAGIVFSTMSIVAIVLEPIYGVIQDKLGLKKYLFAFVILCLLLIGPFFEYAFIPLLNMNVFMGSVLGGAFISLCLYSGVGVVESYCEKSSRANQFEYGHTRLFGSVAGGTFAFVGGVMFVQQPNSIFWVCSIAAILLGIILWSIKVKAFDYQKDESTENEREYVNKYTILELFKNKSFWGLCLLIIGSASLYDVFDQQFPNYFVKFFENQSSGESLFSRLTSTQIFIEAVVMLFMPWIINKIGSKNGLFLFGIILFLRVIGTAFTDEVWLLSFFRLLAAIEMPLMLVSIMKYIVGTFDIRLSATVYMLAFNVAKQLGVAFFSLVMGKLYVNIGFQSTYIVMSLIIIVLVCLGALLMNNDKVGYRKIEINRRIKKAS